jgi:hypothetical protein
VEAFFNGFAILAEGRGSPTGELAGLAEMLSSYDRSKLPYDIRTPLRTFAPAFATLGRYRAVAIFEGAGTPTTFFPREAERAIDQAREALGAPEYDAAVGEGRCMTTDDVAEFVREELAILNIHQPAA